MAKRRRRKSKTRNVAKQFKLQLRINREQKKILGHAAHLLGSTICNFIIEQALNVAHQMLMERVHFALPAERWQAFCLALDAPPRKIPALRELLT
jgi:uncharacterized protein (DUF1778 family)